MRVDGLGFREMSSAGYTPFSTTSYHPTSNAGTGPSWWPSKYSRMGQCTIALIVFLALAVVALIVTGILLINCEQPAHIVPDVILTNFSNATMFHPYGPDHPAYSYLASSHDTRMQTYASRISSKSNGKVCEKGCGNGCEFHGSQYFCNSRGTLYGATCQACSGGSFRCEGGAYNPGCCSNKIHKFPTGFIMFSAYMCEKPLEE